MKNQLPYIAFEGVGKTKEEVLDSLIAIEPLLVMVGWNKPDEVWNNLACDSSNIDTTHLIATENKFVGYYNHSGVDNPICFKATEIKQFINYMIKEGYLK